MDSVIGSLAAGEECEKVLALSDIDCDAISHGSIYRDFSNGYLIAEMLNKYYPQDVQLHSFTNGTGFSSKKNNWGLLQRAFKVIRSGIALIH